MLKGIDPLLTPELLMHLCAMGHNEWVAVVDANFTADFLAQGKPLVRLPGHSLERVAQAILSVYPLADDINYPVGYMQHSGKSIGETTAAQASLVKLVGVHGCKLSGVEAIERFAFYERIKICSLIVQSGETSAYGNAVFSKGLILP